MSPSALAAKSVMPTVATPPSTLAYSCDSAKDLRGRGPVTASVIAATRRPRLLPWGSTASSSVSAADASETALLDGHAIEQRLGGRRDDGVVKGSPRRFGRPRTHVRPEELPYKWRAEARGLPVRHREVNLWHWAGRREAAEGGRADRTAGELRSRPLR